MNFIKNTTLVLLGLLSNLGCFAQNSLTSDSAPIPVVALDGTPYERGYAHGKILKHSIAEVYEKWKKSVAQETGKNADSVIADFIKTSNYEVAIKKWTPELWQEIEGIAAGSGQSFTDVFAFQLIDEYWGYLDRLEHGSVDKDHCSAIGVGPTEGKPAFIAQNIDIDTFMNGHQVLLNIRETPSTPEQYILSCAGFIGFVGLNKNKVGVVINALTDLNNNTTGLPVTFVTRGILASQTGSDAVKFLQDINHATGQNYIIGTENEVINFEASANEIVQFQPLATDKIVYHTNHSIVNHDVKPWMQDYHQRILSGTGPQTNSQRRFSALEKRLQISPESLNPDVVKETLRSKDDPRAPVCVSFNPNAVGFTFSSVLFSFGDEPYLEATNGSPDIADYHRFIFKNNKS